MDMKPSGLFIVLVLFFSILGCSIFSGRSTPTPLPSPVPSETPNTANADVLFVRAEEQEDGSWTFQVTVAHPDTGWEDYANGWDIVLPNQTVVLPDPSSPFTRLLTHPHETEQPFTRSQSGIVIPPGVSSVTVRAHDLIAGFGGKEVTVYLDQANGLNFEVFRLDSDAFRPVLGLTNQRLDGNRYQVGQIDLMASQPIEIPLAGVPVWVTGVALEPGSMVWVAALQDGRLQGFLTEDGKAEAIDLPTGRLPAGMPPAILWDREKEDIDLLNERAPALAEFTHPILTSDGSLAFINNKDQLVIWGENIYQAKKVNAMPDARVLSDGNGKLLLLTFPTDIYEHGVLGDGDEAKSVTLLNEKGDVLERIAIYSDQVIEGIAPIWVDLNGDGQREIILTLSDRRNGAQLVVYSESGQQIGQGEPIGSGYRWRHQIAAAPFGPNREVELVDVLTPHIGGTVEFFQLQGSSLVKVAEVPGYTSHVINSRNLDMALAADVNADGMVELLLPNQNLNQLGIIQRNAEGAAVVGEISLNGTLTSNLAAISFSDGSLAIATGLDSSILQVWLP